MRSRIEVRRLQPGEAGTWKKFLDASNNGTLFHDLDFLGYHPEGRFNTHHLMFYEDGALVALLPAAILSREDGCRVLASPYGASIGGLVLPARGGLALATDLVRALQGYCIENDLGGIRFCLAPAICGISPDASLNFALHSAGFILGKMWLCHVVALPDPERGGAAGLFSVGKRRDLRQKALKGLSPREESLSGLADFYALLVENKDRLNAKPTHQKHELADLMARLPSRIRLFLCRHGDEGLAGVMVFMLNKVAGVTFYICSSDRLRNLCAPTVLLAHVMDLLAGEGIRHLDLGPSVFDDGSINAGLAFFKEGLGGRGYLRESWEWRPNG